MTFISAFSHASNEIPTAIPMFRGRATRRNYWGYCPTSGYVGNQIWRPLTGSTWEITYIQFVYMIVKKFQRLPMFTGSGYRLLRRPPNMWISLTCKDSKMASSNFRLTDEIFDSQLHKSSCFRSIL